MEKIRFSCPKCNTLMQAPPERIGFNVACAVCQFEFQLVEHPTEASKQNSNNKAHQLPPSNGKPAAASTSSQKIDDRIAPTQTWQANKHSETPTQRSFQCQFCGTTQPPIAQSEVSTLGWVVVVLLAITTGCLFWLGFFIRKQYTLCSKCNNRLHEL